MSKKTLDELKHLKDIFKTSLKKLFRFMFSAQNPITCNKRTFKEKKKFLSKNVSLISGGHFENHLSRLSKTFFFCTIIKTRYYITSEQINTSRSVCTFYHSVWKCWKSYRKNYFKYEHILFLFLCFDNLKKIGSTS